MGVGACSSRVRSDKGRDGIGSIDEAPRSVVKPSRTHSRKYTLNKNISSVTLTGSLNRSGDGSVSVK